MRRTGFLSGLLLCFLVVFIALLFQSTVVESTAIDTLPVYIEPEAYDLSQMDLHTTELGSDGDSVENNLFAFEAFIKTTDITDGTEPFDANNNAGNDANAHNNIVRTFDAVTYPIKITINPKNVDKLEDIVLKITGTVENGITDRHVNAKFAVGGYEDVSDGVVGFEQYYTVEQTGNSIMVPISLEIKGAKHGVKLRPKLRVEVVSVDGVAIKKGSVVSVFDALPSVMTSGKVNIKPYVETGLTNQGLPYLPFSSISGDPDSVENVQSFSVAFGLQNLPGKSDNRGATFPTGAIHYHIDLSGSVFWESGPKANQTGRFNFTKRDTPIYLYDQRPITPIELGVGAENTLSEGRSYSFPYADKYDAPLSLIEEITPERVNDEGYNSVWNSGQWLVEKPTILAEKVTYKGVNKEYVIGSTFPEYRSDGYTGGALYGQNDKVFSSNSFIFLMPNEYRIGGENNVDDYANNAYYTVKVVLDSYVDDSGKTVSVNRSGQVEFSERNNPDGSYSIQNTLWSHPDNQQLGTPDMGWSIVSKGDASTIIGSDVRFASILGSDVVSHGGYDAVYRWNTDSFELTKEYAAWAKAQIMNSGYYDIRLEKNANDTVYQKIYYGVPSFTDNTFEVFMKKGKDDYTWYTSFEEAVEKGSVGAMRTDVLAATGPIWTDDAVIPLHVKTKQIGSYTDKGSANVVVTNYYPYLDKARTKMIDVTKDSKYRNPAIWTQDGELTSKQAPSGPGVNFETLAILNAEVSSSIETDKQTYYNSEEIRWSIESSIVLPVSGIPDGYDGSVQVQQTLPKGLDYKVGSGQSGSVKKEPKIVKNTNGSTILVWDLLVSAKGHQLDDITFSTTINPFALTTGVQSSVTVKNEILSPVDTRKAHLRTSSKSVSILKVGMVGIYENIDMDYGPKNSTFHIRMKPYTTIEDEWDVKGLTVIPLSGDELGSMYQGSAILEAIQVNSQKPVTIYLNNQLITSTEPHMIDTSKGGWYKYTGGQQDISKAVSLLFHINGVLTNTDNVEISFSVKTKDNQFGNVYLNETVINSATDYQLSPISNRLRYTIRADAEFDLERIRIYTDNASKHLPVMVRINKDIFRETATAEPITLALYDRSSGKQVYKKAFTVGNLARENELLIPSAFLTKNGHSSYEVRVEGYDTNKLYVKQGADKLDTQGYTSSESHLLADPSTTDTLTYKGVIMTEREVGKGIVSHYESLTIPLTRRKPLISGYGYPLDQEVQYTNDLGDISLSPKVIAVEVDRRAIEGAFYQIDDTMVHLELEVDETFHDGMVTQRFQYPNVYMDSESGSILTQIQSEHRPLDQTVDADHRLYVPIWIDGLGHYTHLFKSTTPIGVNDIEFTVSDSLRVDAYMFGHLNSKSFEDDAVMWVPSQRYTAENDPFKDR